MSSKRLEEKDYVDLLYDKGVHIPSRTIFLRTSEDIEESSHQFIKNLHLLSNISDMHPITINMSSIGGDVTQGMAVYDAIYHCYCDITILVQGEASSMGSYILQAADKRVMAPHATLMIHEGDVEFSGHPRNVAKQSKFGAKYDKMINQILLNKIKQKKPRFTLKQLDQLLVFDTTLTAQEAVDMGLADEILGE